MNKFVTILVIQFVAISVWASPCRQFTDQYERCMYERKVDCQKPLIQAYTGHGAAYINRAMRGQVQDLVCEKMGQYLVKALEALPKMVTTVYRGSGHLKEYQELKTGECIQDRGFLSTSSDVYTAERFAKSGMFLMISTYSGREVTAYSVFPDEDEILLQPGTWLRLIRNPEMNRGLTLYDLEEVTPDKCTRLVTISPNT